MFFAERILKTKMEDQKTKMTLQDLQALLIRVRQRQLSEQDYQLVLRLLNFYQQLLPFLKAKTFNIFRLKHLFNSFFQLKK